MAAERDEDEAHHELTLREVKATAVRDAELERVPDLPMDEDSEAEAEADRYAADDFLLDAAGAASARETSTGRRVPSTTRKRRVDLPALDKTMTWSSTERRRRCSMPTTCVDDEPPEPRRDESATAPAVAAYRRPTFGQPDPATPSRSRRSSRLPLAMTLVFGHARGLCRRLCRLGRATAPAPVRAASSASRRRAAIVGPRIHGSTGAGGAGSAGIGADDGWQLRRPANRRQARRNLRRHHRSFRRRRRPHPGTAPGRRRPAVVRQRRAESGP